MGLCPRAALRARLELRYNFPANKQKPLFETTEKVNGLKNIQMSQPNDTEADL